MSFSKSRKCQSFRLERGSSDAGDDGKGSSCDYESRSSEDEKLSFDHGDAVSKYITNISSDDDSEAIDNDALEAGRSPKGSGKSNNHYL
jgi:hypothetical protein